MCELQDIYIDTDDCDTSNVEGIKKIYFAQYLPAQYYFTGDTYNEIVITTSYDYKVLEFYEEANYIVENQLTDYGVEKTVTITVAIPKISKTKNILLNNLFNKKLVFLIIDNNNKYWFFGLDNYFQLNKNSISNNDADYNLTFVGKTNFYIPEVNTLLSAGSFSDGFSFGFNI